MEFKDKMSSIREGKNEFGVASHSNGKVRQRWKRGQGKGNKKKKNPSMSESEQRNGGTHANRTDPWVSLQHRQQHSRKHTHGFVQAAGSSNMVPFRAEFKSDTACAGSTAGRKLRKAHEGQRGVA